MTWNIERDLTAKNCILRWMVIFAANLTLFHALTTWICIQREEFGNFTIFCRIFCWLVEIYYWLLQNQCSGIRWYHINRFILVNFKRGEITINRFEFTVAYSILYRNIIPNLRLRIYGLDSLWINTSDAKNRPKIQFLAGRSLTTFHVT